MADIWIKIDELPSGFKGYANPLPKVEYRPYKYGEIKALADPALSDMEKARILKDGIRCNFPKDDLYYDDYRLILLYRVLSTIKTQRFEVSYQDGVDADSEPVIIKKKFSLTDIEFSDLKAASLPIVIAIGDDTKIKLNLPSLKRFLEYSDLDMDDDIYLFLQTASVKDAQKIVDDLDTEAVLEIKKLIDSYLRLDSFVRVQLSSGEEVTVPVNVATVSPFREETRPSAIRVESGLAEAAAAGNA